MKDVSLEKELHKLNEISIGYDVKNYIEDIIASNVFSALKDGETSIKIDIFLGSLYIILYQDSISYKFIPSSSLMTKIKESTLNDEDPLILSLDDKIDRKLYKIYRDLLK